VLDILIVAWSVNFGEKRILWVNAPDKDPILIKTFAQIFFSHFYGKLVGLWY